MNVMFGYKNNETINKRYNKEKKNDNKNPISKNYDAIPCLENQTINSTNGEYVFVLLIV